uniref:Uncharacterized protein n=1 Tax=mine drainage metagenome TaxID=410659 RepID=E6PQ81_9ZZZZ
MSQKSHQSGSGTGAHRYPPQRASPGTAHLQYEIWKRENDAWWANWWAERHEAERIEALHQQIRDAGLEPETPEGMRLQRKIERSGLSLCLARNRHGGLCRCLGDGNGGRCKFHGGRSTGARTSEGKARALANLKRGR